MVDLFVGLDLSIDPEVLAALEDPDQFADDIEDDFVVQAMKPEDKQATHDDEDSQDFGSDDESISSGQFSDLSDKQSRRRYTQLPGTAS